MNMRVFSSYQLKWIALITMTIDHFGVLVLDPYTNVDLINNLYIFSRLIGRIAFPLFAFMIAEGVFRSKHPYRYWLRLFAMALFIALAMFVLAQVGINALAGNIFIDLSCAALAMILFKEKSWGIKLLGLLPIFYITWTSFEPDVPNFIRADYGLYGLIMMLIFFLTNSNVFKQTFPKLSNLEIRSENKYAIASLALVMMHVVWYIIDLILNQGMFGSNLFANYLSRFVGPQTYAVFAGYFIYHYRGDKGNPPKWFQTFSYLYYPLHFIGLYGIYLLTTWVQ